MLATCCATMERAVLSTEGLLAYCRPGFEPELAAELSERAAMAGFPGYARTERNAGYVEFLGVESGAALSQELPWSTLIFARQKLRLLDDLPFPLKHLQPVKLYLGARRLSARVYFLDAGTPPAEDGRVVAGQERLVQFILEEPLQVCWGDRFLIQDDSESVILGGGAVLSPHAPQWHKRRAPRLVRLRILNQEEPAEILRHCLQSGGQPVDLHEFRACLNLQAAELDTLLDQDFRVEK